MTVRKIECTLARESVVQTVKLDLDSVRPGQTVGGPTTIYHGPVPGVTYRYCAGSYGT
jgi:hypothetical protein